MVKQAQTAVTFNMHVSQKIRCVLGKIRISYYCIIWICDFDRDTITSWMKGI